MGDSVFAPRVNSARLRDYANAGNNRVVRLPGKLISVKPAENGREMVVLACGGGVVTVIDVPVGSPNIALTGTLLTEATVLQPVGVQPSFVLPMPQGMDEGEREVVVVHPPVGRWSVLT